MVTIIIPVYNVEQYLEECVNSVLNQTYKDLEIILVDDGSTDCSGDICDRYAKTDSRVSAYHKDNGGLSSARNFGMDKMHGDFLMFCDSDDVLHHKAVEITLGIAMKHNVELVEFQFDSFENDIVDKKTKQTESIENVRILSGLDLCRTIYDKGTEIATEVAWSKLYRTSLWEELRFPEGRIHEDTFTIYKVIFGAQRTAYIGVPLYYYRQRPGSIMSKEAEKGWRDSVEALIERRRFFKDIDSRLYIQVTRHLYYKILEMDMTDCFEIDLNEMRTELLRSNEVSKKSKIRISVSKWRFLYSLCFGKDNA